MFTRDITFMIMAGGPKKIQNFSQNFATTFLWVSAHLSGFNIGAPIEYAYSILDDMELPHTKGHTSNPWNKCPTRGLMTTFRQQVGKFLLKSIITLCPIFEDPICRYLGDVP